MALDRAFLLDPLAQRCGSYLQAPHAKKAAGRLTLIANEVARLAGTILAGVWQRPPRKIKDTKNAPDADRRTAQQQLQRLMPKNFMAATPVAAVGSTAPATSKP